MLRAFRCACAIRTHRATWARWQTTSPSPAISGGTSNAGVEVDDKVSGACLFIETVQYNIWCSLGLTDMQIQLRQSVRGFCAEHLAPFADQIDRDNGWGDLRGFFKKCGDMGLLGVTAEEQYGGAGMGYMEHCVVMEEMSRVSAAIALSYGAHSNLCVNQVSC